MVKLGTVCTVVSGTTPKSDNPAYWDGDINWVTPAELSDDTIVVYETARKITELGVKESSLSPFPAGTVLLSSRAPIGKVAIAGVEMYCNQGFKNLICSDSIYNKYLFWFLKSKNEYLNSLGRGATFKEITKTIVEQIDIPLPSIDKQHNVSAILDKISGLISLRKQQLTKLDELVKSRFVEMFGDPNFTNEFCKKQGNMLFNFSSGKFLELEKRQENGVPVYGGNGISWYTKEPMIDFPTIIIGRVGAYCGNVKIVKEPVWITDNAIYIKKFKTEDYNIDFLYYLMNYLNFSQYAEVSGQPKITQKPLESTEYIVPPLSLQNQFAAFVEQTEKTKSAIKQSLNRLETLKKAQMQEFFG